MHTYMYAYMHTYMYAYMHTCMYVHMHTCKTCRHADMQMCIVKACMHKYQEYVPTCILKRLGAAMATITSVY